MPNRADAGSFASDSGVELTEAIDELGMHSSLSSHPSMEQANEQGMSMPCIYLLAKILERTPKET
jgi:hypothetical protein